MKNDSVIIKTIPQNFVVKTLAFRNLCDSSELQNDALIHREGLKGKEKSYKMIHFDKHSYSEKLNCGQSTLDVTQVTSLCVIMWATVSQSKKHRHKARYIDSRLV